MLILIILITTIIADITSDCSIIIIHQWHQGKPLPTKTDEFSKKFQMGGGLIQSSCLEALRGESGLMNNLQPPGPLPLPILPSSNGNGVIRISCRLFLGFFCYFFKSSCSFFFDLLGKFFGFVGDFFGICRWISFGFIANIFWICWQNFWMCLWNFLDLWTICFGFVDNLL